MKKLALLVAVSMLSTGAYAATTTKSATTQKVAANTAATKVGKKTAKAAKAPAAKAAPAATPEVPAPAAKPTETPAAAPSTGASTGGAKSTTSQAAVQPEAKKSRFGLLMVDWVGFSQEGVNRGGTDIAGNDVEADAVLTVRPSYQLTDNTKVAVGIDIEHSYGEKTDAKAVWTPADPYLMLSHGKLGTLPGGITAKGSIRYYAPTSELSQEKGSAGVARGNLTLAKNLGRFTVSYIGEPRGYFYPADGYYKTFNNTKKGGAVEANQIARMDNIAKLDFEVSSKVNLYTLAGLEHKWYNTDDNVKITRHADAEEDLLYVESAVEVALLKNFTLIGGISQEGPNLLRQGPGKEGPAYRDDYASYFLEGDIVF